MHSSTHRDPNRFFQAALLAAILLLALDLAVTRLGAGERPRLIFSDVLGPLVGLACTAVLFAAASQSAAQSRRLGMAWAMIGLSALLYALGDISWGILELGLNAPPFPSIADVFYLAYYPFLLAGVLLLPDEAGSRVERINRLLDTGIIMIAAVLAFWNFLLGPTLVVNAGAPPLEQAILLAYPVGDLVLLAALLLIIDKRSSRQEGPAAFLLAGGLGVTILAHWIYSYQSLQGTYVSGGIVDTGWVAGTLLVGAAGAAQATFVRRAPASEGRPKPDALEEFLRKTVPYGPYVWLIGAYLLLVKSGLSPMPIRFPAMAIGVGGVMCLVLIRQLITLAENDKLNAELKTSVSSFQVQAEKLEHANRELNDEIAERRRVEQRLSHDSLHDSMTKLANRVLFMDRLGQAIEYSKRRPEYTFAVLFVDLDQFKIINDSLGHFTGDQLLISVSNRMKDCLRSSDTVARFGGDEFAILLEMTGDQQFATMVADKILQEIRQPFRLDDHDFYVTASIGIVPSVAGYEEPEEVLRDADIAMYQAKASGKARHAIFDVRMRSLAFSRLETERELRTALECGEFRLYYQPIISLQTGQVASLEALLRWEHPRRGFLLPGEFLPIAEDSGLILPIGEWVLQEACLQLRKWHRKYPQLRAVTVNVNISNRQFLQPDFVPQVMEALSNSGLRPQSLRLEITENVLISNYAAANAVFNKLQELGIQLEIDDFGSGYSALGYLQHLPISTIKIDKTFIDELGKGGRGTELIRAIVSMARELDMETIAEGIETAEQLSELKSLACGFGQGFHLSRPMDRETVQEFLGRQENGS